jgi:CubicO group peptidase (beta-lactamase class C family)
MYGVMGQLVAVLSGSKLSSFWKGLF